MPFKLNAMKIHQRNFNLANYHFSTECYEQITVSQITNNKWINSVCVCVGIFKIGFDNNLVIY